MDALLHWEQGSKAGGAKAPRRGRANFQQKITRDRSLHRAPIMWITRIDAYLRDTMHAWGYVFIGDVEREKCESLLSHFRAEEPTQVPKNLYGGLKMDEDARIRMSAFIHSKIYDTRRRSGNASSIAFGRGRREENCNGR